MSRPSIHCIRSPWRAMAFSACTVISGNAFGTEHIETVRRVSQVLRWIGARWKCRDAYVLNAGSAKCLAGCDRDDATGGVGVHGNYRTSSSARRDPCDLPGLRVRECCATWGHGHRGISLVACSDRENIEWADSGGQRNSRSPMSSFGF
jgi:hypothetical protein